MEHEKEQPSDGVIYVCVAGPQPLARWFKRKEDERKKGIKNLIIKFYFLVPVMMRNWKREVEWKRTDEFGKSGREKFFIKTLQTPRISYNRDDSCSCCPGCSALPPTNVLLQPNKPLPISGIANGKEENLNFAEEMLDEQMTRFRICSSLLIHFQY